METSRYPVLGMTSNLFKLLAILAFMMTAGAVFLEITNVLQQTGVSDDAVERSGAIIGASLRIVVIGFVLMIVFWAISQIIDLLLAMNENLRQIVRLLEVDESIKRRPSGPPPLF